MDQASVNYLAETEVIFRNANQNAAEFIVEEEGEETTTNLPFYCECSNNECHQRIRLRPQEYSQCHQNKRQFIAIAGHEIPEIETIIKRHKNFYIIEKFGDPPNPEDIQRVLKNIKFKS